MVFSLDPRLETDSILVTTLSLCQVRLHTNGAFPWLLLIPEKENMRELIDLSPSEQQLLMAEIAQASHVVKELFAPHKLNVATLGNVVPQLHIHVVARTQEDPAWPGPIWNSGVHVPYAPDVQEKRVQDLRQAFLAKDTSR